MSGWSADWDPAYFHLAREFAARAPLTAGPAELSNVLDDCTRAILKFTNDLSHRTGKGFDPAIVAETQKNVAYLLELIEAVAPKHFNGLKQLSGG